MVDGAVGRSCVGVEWGENKGMVGDEEENKTTFHDVRRSMALNFTGKL